MIKTYTETQEITVSIKVWSCDHPECETSITTNRGCCGVAPIMTCDFCGKHCCYKHRRFIDDPAGGDYPRGMSCLSEECLTKLEEKSDLMYQEMREEDSEDD